YQSQGSLQDLALPCHVDAAINWADRILVFAGCQIWKLSTETSQFHPDGNLTDKGLPCQLNAAVQWSIKGAIFVKGLQFWKFDDVMLGPFHTDDLHLCSWYLCGEADWMMERTPSGKCNGDSRFCSLRVDQVTLAGLHNAGAGFAGGFGLLNCLLRNHAENISRQLELGIRHLDIDPCYDTCGLLGTCHTFMCGGSICTIIKQLRTFLRDNRGEIVTINFNHEIKDPEKVFPRLTKQLQTQLGPMLNGRFRVSGEKKWPTLRQSVRSNKRVFIFYAPIINQSPHNRLYKRHKWIHNEDFYASTWRPFSVGNGCQEVIPITKDRCQVRQWRELVEVSIVPESGACIYSMAESCRMYLHEALKACELYRFQVNKSPNVLLVDYPEVGSQEVTSVFHAVYHQNLRNLVAHLPGKCQVKLDAAVRIPGSETSFFFVGDQVLVYSHSKKSQVDSRPIPSIYDGRVDAAYMPKNASILRIIKGCEMWQVDAGNFSNVLTPRSQMSPCVQPDDAVVWQSRLYIFKGCYATLQGLEPIPLADWGLPCDIDAAFNNRDHIAIFKGNDYWKYTGQGNATRDGKTLDWTIDAVRCSH
ncbi:unnamed protein product, partial [Candidula unifasciata]